MGRPACRRSSIPTIPELMWVAGGLREASRTPQELSNAPVTIVIHLGSVFSHREASTAAQGRLGAAWRTIRVSAKKSNTSSNILLLKKIRVYILNVGLVFAGGI